MQLRTLFPPVGPALRHRSRAFAALILALASFPLLATASASQGAVVTANVTNLRSAEGVVRACLTSDPKDFPDCRNESTSRRVTVPAATSVTLVFSDIPPGTYAISILHDENGNGKMDKAMLMMPKEGYAFSRDAKVVMGPPKFKNAAFVVAGEPAQLPIRMRYMF